MLMYAVAFPPVLVAVMVYIVRVGSSACVPLSTPVDAPKAKPLGTEGLMAQVTISPEPVMVGESGRSSVAGFGVLRELLAYSAHLGSALTIVMLM